MSYALVHRPVAPVAYAPLGAQDFSAPSLVPILLGVGVLALVGFLIYERMQLTKQIVHEQGVGKALEFEGGTAAIGVLAGAFSRNKRRRARRRRR